MLENIYGKAMKPFERKYLFKSWNEPYQIELGKMKPRPMDIMKIIV
jgi:hypothetical protein